MNRCVAVVVAVVLAQVSVRPAQAESDLTCERLEAEARAEALQLYAPRVVVSGARSPAVVDAADPTAPGASVLQARAALQVSPIEMLQGRAVERVAAAECRRDAASLHIERVLALGERTGELTAVSAELAYLTAHIAEVDAIVDATVARVERQRATAIELLDMRERRARLRVRIRELEHSRAMLAETERAATPRRLGDLAASYQQAARGVDQRKGDLRALRAWRIDVQAGVAGGEQTDWFALVQVGYSLGQPWQAGANRRATQAHAAELARGERSLTVRLDVLRRSLRESAVALAAELVAIDDELALLRAELERVRGVDSETAQQLRDRIAVELVGVEARRTYVATLASARRAYVEGLQ